MVSSSPLELSKSSLALFLFVTLLIGNSAAVGFDFQQPVDVSAGENPKEYASSPQDLYFQVELSNVGSDGTLTLQQKSSGSKTWTGIDSANVESYYNDQNYYFQDANNNFYVNESSDFGNTITIEGNEYTFDIGAIDESQTPELVTNVKVDGAGSTDHYTGDIIGENPEGKYIKIVDVSTNNPWNTLAAEFEIYDPVSVSNDYWQYRVKFDDGSNLEYSESIYFSVGKGHNIPYVDYTEINSDHIYDFNTTQDRTADSDVYANVKDDETDTYNVTLYDASDDSKVAEVQTGSDFKTMFAYAISDFFSLGDLSREDNFFTTSSDSFMSQTDTAYSYYFEVEDLNDGGSRLTPVYQFNTGTTSNSAPNITAVEGYDGSTWKPLQDFNSYGEFVNKIRVKVDDPDNDFHDGYLRIENNYDDKVLVGGNQSNPVNGSEWDYLDNNYNLVWNMSKTEYNFSRVLDSGNFTADVYVTDYNQNNSKSDKWSVSWGTYQVNSYTACGETAPANVEMNESETCNASLEAECVGGECSSESGVNISDNMTENTTAILDPKPVEPETGSVKSSKQNQLFSLEYWRSWIEKVFQ